MSAILQVGVVYTETIAVQIILWSALFLDHSEVSEHLVLVIRRRISEPVYIIGRSLSKITFGEEKK